MGRGRAKAKQTKVARRLKYHSPNTDLNALERELSGGGAADDEYDEEPYVDYVPQKEKDVGDTEPREDDWVKKHLSPPPNGVDEVLGRYVPPPAPHHRFDAT